LSRSSTKCRSSLWNTVQKMCSRTGRRESSSRYTDTSMPIRVR